MCLRKIKAQRAVWKALSLARDMFSRVGFAIGYLQHKAVVTIKKTLVVIIVFQPVKLM